ncbi:MAG: MFS transporter [Candidatus Gottesmanbacteria bacterium]|nr:MFS transporter [Candidatus Gottesmanbacteria bacterium]
MHIAKNIKLLSWLNFCTDFVFFAPVAILYFAHVTGSYALGMSIFSIAYVSSAMFEVPTGIISDLVGRKKTTILGALSAVACVLLYAIGGSYWVLATGSLFQGLSRAFYSGNNDALLHDTLREIGKENEYHTYLGKTGSMFQLALAIAAVIGGILAARSYALVIWASVIPQIGAFIIALLLVEPKRISSESTNVLHHLSVSMKYFVQNRKLRMLSIASALRFGLGESGYLLRSAFVITLWPLWAIGIASFLGNIGAAISYYFAGKVITKYTPYKVLNFEILSNRIINFVALLFPTVLSPALMSIPSLLFGVGSVALGSLFQREFTQSQRATMGSLNALLGHGVFGICSIAVGLIADRFDARVALIVINILLLTPLFFYRKIFLHERANGGRIRIS